MTCSLPWKRLNTFSTLRRKSYAEACALNPLLLTGTPMNHYEQLDSWIDAHFDEQVKFLQQLIQVPTDTPPGNNTPHAERAADLLDAMGLTTERHAVPHELVKAAGLQTITNLVVRRKYGAGRTIALNAHGDVVPPGEGWVHNPYGGEIENGKIYGRAAAVSKCDFSTYAFAVRALESLGIPLHGNVELLFTYDEEFGGEVGPAWLLQNKLTKPDLMIAHNGCLQMQVTVHGKMAHAAIPETGIDALQGANKILTALYAQNKLYEQITSNVEGIKHPYLNVGSIEAAAGKQAAGASSAKACQRGVWRTHPRAGHAALYRCADLLRGRHSRCNLWSRPAHGAGIQRQARR